MKGDFTRDTFDPLNHFSRVLMQQGRVQLDADWNEQVAILLHYLQTLAADLIGPYGGPADNNGFEIFTKDKIDKLPEGDAKKRLANLLERSKPPLVLGKGRYYVDGMLCENLDDIAYSDQLGYPFPGDPVQFAPETSYLVYLDVWERHLTCVEVEDAEGRRISIRETALNGLDTATRAQVVWQVKIQPGVAKPANDAAWNTAWSKLVEEWQPVNRGRLKARAIKMEPSDTEDPCITRPESRYRGAENQLYRVEIHEGGTAQQKATFKWSRENGSVIFPIHKIAGVTVTLEALGRDAHLGLQPGDWVEIVDDDYSLHNRAEPLLQVEAIDLDKQTVTLKAAPALNLGQDLSKHPLLRRWDQRKAERSDPSRDGVLIIEGQDDDGWIELEDGVQIQFQSEPGAIYRTGDYWLIPARTATGDVEWPGRANAPEARGPHGVAHHYAPLSIISATEAGELRRPFKPVWKIPEAAEE
jgi:hypothetical protein